MLSLEEYARLPLEQPTTNCYIATAASRGHTWFVGSRTIRLEDGRRWQVNRQLVVLKTGEIALRVLTPRLHSWLRVVYDRIGPVLARRLGHPILADLAYLALKPIEWLTRFLLVCLLGKEGCLVYQPYCRDLTPKK